MSVTVILSQCSIYCSQDSVLKSSDKINLFKGDLLCKKHFYKVFEHSCMDAVCQNNQPIMLKIHQLIYL